MGLVAQLFGGVVLLTLFFILVSMFLGDLPALLKGKPVTEHLPPPGTPAMEPASLAEKIGYIHEHRMRQLAENWRIQASAWHHLLEEIKGK